MTTAELIAEDKLRRQEVREPTLDWKNHLTNFAVSIPGIGGTVASFFSVAFHVFKPPEDGIPFVERMEKFASQWRGRESNAAGEVGVEKQGFGAARKEFLKDKNFRQNVNASAVVFAVVSAVTAVVTYRMQHREASEDGVTRATHIKNVMRERGYIRMEDGEFLKRKDADRHYGRLDKTNTDALTETQDKILSKVEALEASLKKEAMLEKQSSQGRG